LKFLCGPAELVVSSTKSVITAESTVGTSLRIPVNHFEGNYTCDAETLVALRESDQIVLRYADNPNGSVDDIAGICNERGNVVGLMPHPERAAHALLGSRDGAALLRSFVGESSRVPSGV
jgi:phosphoribosylformylglycinamidine synthase